MNKKQIADEVRRCAASVERSHDYTCQALEYRLHTSYEIGMAVQAKYCALFRPGNIAEDDSWFGPLSERVYVGMHAWMYHNNEEAQGRRVIALCLLADIIETEGL